MSRPVIAWNSCPHNDDDEMQYIFRQHMKAALSGVTWIVIDISAELCVIQIILYETDQIGGPPN